MTVAVTGATGHIGLNLISHLVASGQKVRALYFKPDFLTPLQQWDVECRHIDVRDPNTLTHAFDDCDIVYHLAAIISIDGDQHGNVNAVNVDGARNVAQAALQTQVRRLVHVSSIHAFAREPHDQPVNEQRARISKDCGSAYDFSKACGEAAVREVVQQGLDAVIVHPTGVIGPLDYRYSFLGQGLLDFYHQKFPLAIAGGFNFVHVQDVVEMLVAAATKGRCNESYIVGGEWQSIHALAKMVEAVTGVPAPRWRCPLWLAKSVLPLQKILWNLRQQDPLYTLESLETLSTLRVIDDSKARRELGHNPRTVESAVYDLFHWLVQNGKIPTTHLNKPASIRI